MRRKRGFTLVEIIVYSVLALLLLGLISSLLVLSRRNYEATSSSYLVGRDAEVAIRWLRTELQETALTSLRVYPSPDNSSEAPGMSLLSARDPSKGFTVTPYGAPDWSREVFYTLDGTSLIRWEQKRSDSSPIPVAPTGMPSVTTGDKRVVLRGLAEPGTKLPGLGQLDNYGGFRAAFVRHDSKGEIPSSRQDESLTAWNPSQVTLGKDSRLSVKGNTRQLEVTIVVQTKSSATGKKSLAQLPFRVTPRH